MILKFLVAVALGLAAIVAFFQERLIFFPEKLPQEHRFRFTESFAERWFEVDGRILHSLQFRQPGSKGVILYFHGNAGNLDSWGEVAAELSHRTKWDVWVLDYPGYGKSEGSISSEAQLVRVAEAFLRLGEKDYAGRPLILFGRSIGTGLAIHLAKSAEGQPQVRGVVLETPYLSLSALAKVHYPWVPGIILKYQFQSAEKIKTVGCPVLIIHGTDDEIIPVSQGQELAKLAKSAALVEVAGGHHNDLGVYPDYWRALEAWVSERH